MTEYVLIGALLLIVEMVYILLASKIGIVDRPHHQSSHTGVVVRGGGHHLLYCLSGLVYPLRDAPSHDFNRIEYYGLGQFHRRYP